MLLGELDVLVAEVGTDREAMRDAAEKVDLPGLAGLDEGVLGLMAELSGENLVDLCRLVSLRTYQLRDGLTYEMRQWTADLE